MCVAIISPWTLKCCSSFKWAWSMTIIETGVCTMTFCVSTRNIMILQAITVHIVKRKICTTVTGSIHTIIRFGCACLMTSNASALCNSTMSFTQLCFSHYHCGSTCNNNNWRWCHHAFSVELWTASLFGFRFCSKLGEILLVLLMAGCDWSSDAVVLDGDLLSM